MRFDDEDPKITEKILEGYRVGNIEFKFDQGWNKSFEILKWYPNGYYNQENSGRYIWNEERGMYQDTNYPNTFIDKGCFKHPESCFVIAFIELDKDGDPDTRSVGSRIIDLPKEELEDFDKVIRYAYKILEGITESEFNKWYVDYSRTKSREKYATQRAILSGEKEL